MAIINGNNTIFATFNSNQFFIDKALQYSPPVYGYAVTQAAYDQLTPEAGIYYAIISTATGESITAVLELTQAQYDGMSTHDATTLYIITDGGSISDAFVGDTECDKLYQGSTELWAKTSYLLPDWFPQIDIESYFAPYQSNSAYYFDTISADGSLPNWSYYYERTYYQNPAQGEVNYNKTGTYTIQSYATWYTTSTSHKTVTLKVVNGNVENIQMTEGSWTTSRQNLNGGNIEHQNNEKPWLIKQTMTTVNITGNYTPEKIGF